MDYMSVSSSPVLSQSGFTRKELLRKSTRDLHKECKKYSISTKGNLDKGDLVNLLLTKKTTSSKRKKIVNHQRSSTAALMNKSSKQKKQRKTNEEELRFGNKYTLDGTMENSVLITPKNIKNKYFKKKKRNHGRAQSDALTLKSSSKSSSFVIINSNNNKNNKNNNKHHNGLKMEYRLNGITETKTDEPFIENMSLSEIQILQINDCVDFRDENGFVFKGTIIDKLGSTLTITYKDNIGDLQRVKTNYHSELYRFGKYKSISRRSSHRMIDLLIGNTVDINPRHIINEWMIGEVVNKDFKSGQCQIEYSLNNTKYLYWVHTDNILEIAPYLTHYDMSNVIDSYLDENNNKNNKNNNNDYEQWKPDDIIKWINSLENGKFNDIKYKKLKDGIKEYNINYNKLLQINELTLNMLGINNEKDIKLIIKSIKNKTKQQSVETELIRLKEQVFLQKEEISALKLKRIKNNKSNNNSINDSMPKCKPRLKASASAPDHYKKKKLKKQRILRLATLKEHENINDILTEDIMD